MLFGTAVHAAFERVGWLDDEAPDLPPDEAGQLVADLLAVPELRGIFQKAGETIELRREQPIDAILNGQWLSGVIDRLHLHRAPDGTVTRLEVLDFKTDAVDHEDELLARHQPQMRAYRDALALAYPGAAIRCRLLSTRLRRALVAC